MAFDAHKDFAYGVILTPPSPATTGTSFTLNAGQGALFPTPPFNITVWRANTTPLATNAEIMRCTALVGDTFTVLRNQESTTALTFAAGDQVAATITAKTLQDIETAAGTPGPTGPTGATGATGPPGPAIGVSGRHYLNCNGVSTGYTTPYNAAFNLTDNLGLRVMVKPGTWTPAVRQIIFSHWIASPNRAYEIALNTDGSLAFLFTVDGTTIKTINSSASMSAVAATDNAPIWLRADYVANVAGKSQVTFSYSVDNEATWVQLGAVVTNATPGPLASVTGTGLQVGGDNNSANCFVGRIYLAEVWNNTTPAMVAQFDARGLTTPSVYTGVNGLVWTAQGSAAVAQDEISFLDMLDKTVLVQKLIPGPEGSVPTVSGGVVNWATPAGGGNSPSARIVYLSHYYTAGTTDHTAALTNALAAATPVSYGSNYEAGAGVVICEPDVLGISGNVQIPNHVDLVGCGKRLTVFKALSSSACITFGDVIGGTAHKGGISGNFFMDGNSLATTFLKILDRTGCIYEAIEIQNCAGDAAYMANGQNSLFLELQITNNAGNGMIWDAGWGGHTYIKCEIASNGSLGGTPGSRTGYYNLKCYQTVATSVLGEPSNNRMYGCILERAIQAGAAGNCYFGAGYNLSFDRCDFASGGATTQTPVFTFRYDGLNGSTRTRRIRFTDPNCNGTQSGAGTGTVFCDAAGANVSVYFMGTGVITPHDVIWKVDDAASVWADTNMKYQTAANYDQLFANGAGGSMTLNECVRNPAGPAFLHAAATDALVSGWFGSVSDGMEAINVNDPARKYLRAAGAWKSVVYS